MRGLHIASINNNDYFYNDETGFIELQDKNTSDEVVNFLPDIIPKVSCKQVEHYLYEGYGFRQLILELCHSCNLRCKYCIYDDHYQETRQHGSALMTFNTAKKAVDHYLSAFQLVKHKNPLKKPLIGFYGGEPLLNFDVLKEIVEYIDENYKPLQAKFNITTNGLLLNQITSDFLTNHNFAILVSLDGDQENHDRNRIKPNGEGSFDDIYHHLLAFKKNYPNYNKISISSCYDYNTNLIKMADFFSNNDFHITNITGISNQETHYFDQFSIEDKNKFYKQYTELQSKFFDMVKTEEIIDSMKGLYMPLFGYGYMTFLLHRIKNQPAHPLIPYTNTCVPGEKIFVNVEGVFNICERVNRHFPIGNIEEGLDYNRITDIVNDYNSQHSHCNQCNISRLCNICFSTATDGDKISISKNTCEEKLNSVKGLLLNYINLMEESPTQFKNLLRHHYDDVNRIANGFSC